LGLYIKRTLTIKSDDMEGRNETLNNVLKNTIPKFGIPESFKVLLHKITINWFRYEHLYKIENLAHKRDMKLK
jgi:hypothetical protein